MAKESKTLFVRNLPFTATKEKLEETFSNFGPIKQCFIVTDKGTGANKGFGYVQFSLFEDAITARKNVQTIDNRKLLVEYADSSKKKGRMRKRKKAGTVDEESREDEEEAVQDADRPLVQGGSGKPEHSTPGGELAEGAGGKTTDLLYHKAKILVVRGLSGAATEEQVRRCLQQMNVKKAAEVKCPDSRTAHVKFKCIRDAKNAIRKLQEKQYQGNTLTAVQLSKDNREVMEQPHLQKRSRVIVRNISFKSKEEDLYTAFQDCGEVVDVHIPSNREGRMCGFGFVQFADLPAAQKAVDTMHAVKIQGRPVAVDWAIPKDKFEKATKQTSPTTGKNRLLKQDSEDEGYGEIPAKRDTTDDCDMSPDEGQNVVSRKRLSEDDSSDEESDDDEGDSSDDDKEPDSEDNSDEKDSDDDSDSDDENDSHSDSEDGSRKKKSKTKGEDKKKTAPRKSDVDQGRTIFIRNLSFDRDEEGLSEHFSKFGAVSYSKIVMDKQTEHSRGMAFVQFKMKEGADNCLSEAQESGIVLDGRELIISLALSREAATKCNQSKQKEKKDNRNLYLAREGMIRPGTQAAEGLSKVDLDKRMKVEEVKRQKLKDVDIFISPLRLCIRNLPVSVDDKELRKVFLTAAGTSEAKITECRIMRDLNRVNSEGKGKSMGYGFVCFADHQHALAALRKTNNNPDLFGEKKRPIVEFSLENRKALEVKQKRLERQKMKQEMQLAGKGRKENPRARKAKGAGKGSTVPGLHVAGQEKGAKGDNPSMKKGLPSHWGPKIRHKPRESQQSQGKKKKKKGNQKAGQGPGGKVAEKRPPSVTSASLAKEGSRKKRKMMVEDNFDKLVNKYKQKFSGVSVGSSKWLD